MAKLCSKGISQSQPWGKAAGSTWGEPSGYLCLSGLWQSEPLEGTILQLSIPAGLGEAITPGGHSWALILTKLGFASVSRGLV